MALTRSLVRLTPATANWKAHHGVARLVPCGYRFRIGEVGPVRRPARRPLASRVSSLGEPYRVRAVGLDRPDFPGTECNAASVRGPRSTVTARQKTDLRLPAGEVGNVGSGWRCTLFLQEDDGVAVRRPVVFVDVHIGIPVSGTNRHPPRRGASGAPATGTPVLQSMSTTNKPPRTFHSSGPANHQAG